jgi:hypothetical protein
MLAPRALLGLTVATAGIAVAACSSSGPDTTAPSTSPPAAQPTSAALPFHYEALGQSSSPTFHVDKDGSYTVAYTLKGSADQPGCVASLAMVGSDGSAQQIVGGVKLQPADSKQSSLPETLKRGDWRFQEGGGCSWSVTVTAG